MLDLLFSRALLASTPSIKLGTSSSRNCFERTAHFRWEKELSQTNFDQAARCTLIFPNSFVLGLARSGRAHSGSFLSRFRIYTGEHPWILHTPKSSSNFKHWLFQLLPLLNSTTSHEMPFHRLIHDCIRYHSILFMWVELEAGMDVYHLVGALLLEWPSQFCAWCECPKTVWR